MDDIDLIQYYTVAEITLALKSDLPAVPGTFASKFSHFEVDCPTGDIISICHHFNGSMDKELLDRVAIPENRRYFRPPWAIYQHGDELIYQRIKPAPPHGAWLQTVVTDSAHSRLDIFNDHHTKEKFNRGGLTSLTLFPTDQVLIGQLMGLRNGGIIHSLGIILNGKGFLFVGHSDAGKSTMAGIVKNKAVILCDDRNVIWKKESGYRLSGTWSHGDVPDVSAETAPLAGIFFLQQAPENKVEPIVEPMAKFEKLLPCLIRPLGTKKWWDRSLSFLEDASNEIAGWQLKFDKSGDVFHLIDQVARDSVVDKNGG